MNISSRKMLTLLGGFFIVGFISQGVFAAEEPSEECLIPKHPTVSDARVGYQVWPGDDLQVSVWQNPELSMAAVVRPDGRISIPLVEELDVAGVAPDAIARMIEERLASYIKNPLVTVIVTGFGGSSKQSIRVIGAAVKPQDIRYNKGMTLLDLAVQLGGLSQYAAGNRAKLVREVCGQNVMYELDVEDLINGEVEKNVNLQPGDIVVIPESIF